MLRPLVFALLVSLVTPLLLHAQGSFHWDVTSGPGTACIQAFQVAPNGDFCVLVNEPTASFEYDTHYFRKSGSHWTTVPVPHITGTSQITFGSRGSAILLLDQGLLRINSDGSTTMITGAHVGSLQGDRQGRLVAVFDDTSLVSSTDEGNSWITIPSPPLKVERTKKDSVIKAAAYDADIKCWFASTDSCVYVSSDNGKSWPIMSLRYGSVTRFEVGHNGKVWTISYVRGYMAGFESSTDSGRTWKNIRDGIRYGTLDTNTSSPLAVDRNNLVLTASYTAAVAFVSDSVMPQGQYYVGQQLYYPSTCVTLDSSGRWYACISHQTGRLMFTCTGPSDPWQPFNDIPGANININGGFGYTPPLIVLPFGLIAIVYDNNGPPGHPYFSSDRGDHWDALQPFTDTSTPSAIASMPLKGSRYLGIGITGALVISEDGKKSWKYPDHWIHQWPTAIVDHGDTVYVSIAEGFDSLYRSTNGGATWQTPTVDLDFADALGVDSAGILYRSSFHDVLEYADWGKTNLHGTSVGNYVDQIFISGPHITLTSDQDGLTYQTTDHGVTWKALPINGQCFYVTRDNDILVGAGNELKCIPHGTGTVINVGVGLSNDPISWIDQDPSGTLYLSTNGSSVWRSSGDIHNLAVHPSSQVPTSVICYPNPASTVIAIEGFSSLPRSIDAVDVLGDRHKIARIGESNSFDVRALPKGIYRIMLDGEHRSARFVVTR